jgi:hypothetical protein
MEIISRKVTFIFIGILIFLFPKISLGSPVETFSKCEKFFIRSGTDVLSRDMTYLLTQSYREELNSFYSILKYKRASLRFKNIFIKGGIKLSPNLIIYGTVGNLIDQYQDITFDGLDDCDYYEFNWHKDYALGLGGKIKFFETAEKLSLVADFSYMRYKSNMFGEDYKVEGISRERYFLKSMEDLFDEDPNAFLINYTSQIINEAQFSLLVNKTFRLFDTYAGIKFSNFYSKINFDVHGKVDSMELLSNNISRAEQENSLGFFAGTEFYITQLIAVNLEVRYFDERSASISILYRGF